MAKVLIVDNGEAYRNMVRQAINDTAEASTFPQALEILGRDGDIAVLVTEILDVTQDKVKLADIGKVQGEEKITCH